MATDLRITPARRALLQAINDGAVIKRRGFSGSGPERILHDRGPAASWPPGRWAVVTTAAELLITAGLARVGPQPLRWTDPRPLLLTDAGRERLGGGS
jgi:hypothetical protein